MAWWRKIPGGYTLERAVRPLHAATECMAFTDPPVRTGSKRWCCLNIGCGNDYIPSTPEREWVNADIARTVKADAYFDAFTPPYPLKDAEFDLIKAYDFMEHIPHTIFGPDGKPRAGDGFFLILDEFSRVLKPGGIVEARFPAYGHVNNAIDPTHTRQILRETFTYYLEKTGAYSFYTTRHWELVSFDSTQVDNHFARLRKL